jgi:hypothetical protein
MACPSGGGGGAAASEGVAEVVNPAVKDPAGVTRLA